MPPYCQKMLPPHPNNALLPFLKNYLPCHQNFYHSLKNLTQKTFAAPQILAASPQNNA